MNKAEIATVTAPGPYEANVIEDSIASGVRLTTLCVCIPRIVLAEFNTHRVFSRNSASSRAIPVKKRIQGVLDDPFVPLSFGKNKAGMQAKTDLDGAADAKARGVWMEARDRAVEAADMLADLDVHKQLANRLLEPFAWQTIIVTATEWENYWALRISEYAQPEIRTASENMKAAMDASTPRACRPGDDHLPLTTDEEREALPTEQLVQLSSARCARVSYLTHGGDRDLEADYQLYDRLYSAGHMSPFEHVAGVARVGEHIPSNFRAPWLQYRKTLKGEAVYRR